MDDDLDTTGVVGTTGKQQAVATAAAPTFGQRDAVPLSVTLNGSVRIA